jgi:PAS domain S-box-containing protein
VVNGASYAPNAGDEPERASEATRDTQARLRAIFSGTITGTEIVDTEGRFLETNSALQWMLGYSEDELRGKHFGEITHPEDASIQQQLHTELVNGARDRYQLEKRHLHKEGGWHWSRVTASLIRADSGAPWFVLCSVEDVEESRREAHERHMRAHQQSVVAEFGRYALASTDLTTVLNELAKLVAQTLELDYSMVWELLPEAESLLLRVGVGCPKSLIDHATIEAGRGSQAGFTLLSQNPVIVAEARAENRFTIHSLLQEQGVISSMTVGVPGGDRPFGVLGAYDIRNRTFTQQDADFLQAMAHVLAAALARYSIEDRRLCESRELAARVLQAQEEERLRIARELHDETLQGLFSVLVNIDLLEARMPAGAAAAKHAADRIRSIAQHTLDETRALSYALRPAVLDDLGLAASLKELGDECMQTYRIQIVTKADPIVERRLSPEVQLTLYKVAQEALVNVCKHAEASRAEVQISLQGHGVELLIEDDGAGFHPCPPGSMRRANGLGLLGMQERATSIAGTLFVESAPGSGTRVRLLVPIADDSVTIQTVTADVGLPTDQDAVRVLLVDDHAVFRDGLRMVLDDQDGMIVVGEAEDGRRAVDLVEQVRPNVVVMDLAMPNLNGLDATAQIKQKFPDVKVVIITAHETREYLARIAKVRAEACVLKRSAGAELVAAIRAVVRGESYISSAIAGDMLDDYRVRIDRSGGDDMLTTREHEVLQLIAEGHTNREIARDLVVSVKTVEAHRTHVMRKLGVHDRTGLVKHAMRLGIVSADA